jgi:hypothetical protein
MMPINWTADRASSSERRLAPAQDPLVEQGFLVRGIVCVAPSPYFREALQNARELPKTAPTIEDTDLMKLYRDKTFMPSKFISQMKLP